MHRVVSTVSSAMSSICYSVCALVVVFNLLLFHPFWFVQSMPCECPLSTVNTEALFLSQQCCDPLKVHMQGLSCHFTNITMPGM